MKKMLAVGFAAALATLPASGVVAEEVTPKTPTVSTQGTLAGPAVLGIVALGVLIALGDSSSGT